MSDTLISVENIGKKFCRSLKKSLWYGCKDIGSELLGRSVDKNKLRSDEFWALKDISFNLRRGQCLGLIGRNGAGKSTLLKLLNGLIKPDLGEIRIKGRVGALIELGSGFNPILTGRENIYINGSLLGFTKSEVDNKIDSIIEFAEIDEFLDTPLKNYSSGMKVRLGFAVAAHMEPDVLIIDEVLAVGDVGFRAKCFNAMSKIAKNAAVIFVSHAMPQVARTASEILLLNNGKEVFYSKDVPKGIELYYDFFESEKMIVTGDKAELHDIRLFSREEHKKERVPKIEYLDNLIVEIDFSLKRNVKSCRIHLAFFDKELRSIAQFVAKSKTDEFTNEGDVIRVKAYMPKLPFAPGVYTLTVGFGGYTETSGWIEPLARYQAVKEFRVVGDIMFSPSPILLNGDWIKME